jgi:AcrR family transcriptional regulator
MRARLPAKEIIVAKPRKHETEDTILDAAWRLFGEQGYPNVSYNDLAEESGIKKGTVQHYFPKKEEILLGLLCRLRENSRLVGQEMEIGTTTLFEHLYILGQIYLSSLMYDSKTRRFFSSVLENRALTDEAISLDFSWSKEFVGVRPQGSRNGSFDPDMVVAMGGLYELMFHCIRHDEPIDIPQRLMPPFFVLANRLGIAQKACQKMLLRCQLPDKKLRSCAEEALGLMLQEE